MKSGVFMVHWGQMKTLIAWGQTYLLATVLVTTNKVIRRLAAEAGEVRQRRRRGQRAARRDFPCQRVF